MHSHSAMDRKADGNRFAPFARRKKTPSGVVGLFDREIQVQHLLIKIQENKIKKFTQKIISNSKLWILNSFGTDYYWNTHYATS